MLKLSKEEHEYINMIRKTEDLEGVLSSVLSGQTYYGDGFSAIKPDTMSLKTMITALTTTYEVMLSPEEEINKLYQNYIESYRDADYWTYEEGYAEGAMKTIEQVCELLSIKLEKKMNGQ